MKRLVYSGLFALVFVAVYQSLVTYLPSALNLFFLPPVVLVFALNVYRPLEIIASCLVFGFITDVTFGMIIGSNMLLMLVMAFVLSTTRLAGRNPPREQIFYVMAVSFLYRLIAMLASILFLGPKANIQFSQLIFGPIMDGLLSPGFYKLLIRILLLFKAFEQSDIYNNRLGLRQ